MAGVERCASFTVVARGRLCCLSEQNLKADLKRCEAVVKDVDVTVENITSDSAETDMKVSFRSMHIASNISSSLCRTGVGI